MDDPIEVTAREVLAVNYDDERVHQLARHVLKMSARQPKAHFCTATPGCHMAAGHTVACQTW